MKQNIGLLHSSTSAQVINLIKPSQKLVLVYLVGE